MALPEDDFQPDAQLEHRTVHRTVSVGIDRCVEVAVDFPAYPEWTDGIDTVELIEPDHSGRPSRVKFSASALGRQADYELLYNYSSLPNELSWTMVSGDVTRKLEGAYKFVPSVDVDGGTDITYELTIDLAVPLPGFVKRRVEAKIITAALESFAKRVEASA